MSKFSTLIKRTRLSSGSACITLALFAAVQPNCFAISYTYEVTAAPNWALGNPQPVSVTYCSAVAVGVCGANVENDVTVKLLGNPTTYYAYTTPLGAANGVIGSDVSIPTAFWVSPAVYWWTDTGPFGGGELAFFNSVKNGVAYANEMIVLDPFSESATFADLEALDLQAGGNGILPNPVSTTINQTTGAVNVPSLPGFEEAPEPSSVALLGLGLVGASLFRKRRKQFRDQKSDC